MSIEETGTIDDPRVLRSRAAVMDAAIALFVDGGVNGVTVDAVAARARVAKTTIYRHWPERASLIIDTVRSTFEHVRTPDTGSLRGDLLALACGPCGQANELPMSVLGGLMTALQNDPALSAAWRRRFLEPRLAATRAIFDRAVRRGEVDPDVDLDLILTILPSMCAYRSTVGGGIVDADFVARVLDDIILPTVRQHPSSRNVEGNRS